MELLAVVLYNRYFTGSVLNYNLKSTIPFISAANYETAYEIFKCCVFLSTKEKKNADNHRTRKKNLYNYVLTKPA